MENDFSKVKADTDPDLRLDRLKRSVRPPVSLRTLDTLIQVEASSRHHQFCWWLAITCNLGGTLRFH
eukprot:scaffold880_cov132-Cylindrotheca_fusiformis.AAC.30